MARRFGPQHVVGLLVACLWLLAAATANAQGTGGSAAWQRFDVALDLQPDGSLQVAETQVIRFRGTLRHGYRVVPLDRTTGISQVQVSEIRGGQEIAYTPGSERANTFATSRVSDGLAIDWWFGPTQGTETRTFVVRYVAAGATRVYDDSAQVWWQAIYADRGGPVEAGTVRLALPAPVDPSSVELGAYRIATSGRAQEIEPPRLPDQRTVQLDVGNLSDGTGVEIRAQVPRAIVPSAQTPPWQADIDRAQWIQESLAPIGTFLALLLSLVIAVGGGVAVFLRWYSHGREPDIGSVPAKLDDPPSQLPAPLVGTLVDGVADLQDAVATLVDLARRGVLSLKHDRGDVLVSLHAATDDPALRPYERVFLTALFGPGVSSGEILLSSARTRFAAAAPVLEDRLYSAMTDEGLFVANPEATRRRYMGLGWTLVVAGVVLAFLAAAWIGWVVAIAWLPGVTLAAVGLVLVLVARAMPRRTPRGALEAERWKAFRAHLRDDQEDARADEFLPYAVAFGIDREYLHRLEPVAAPTSARYHGRHPGGVVFLPGGWYGGGGGFGGRPGRGDQPMGTDGSGAPSPQGWSDALADLLNSASEAMAHGGGSGRWGGGGFGGGGGGGGGRGGFN